MEDGPEHTPPEPAEQAVTTSEPLAPVNFADRQAFMSDLSEAEQECISESIDSDSLKMFFQSGDLGSDADVQGAFRNCLAYETVLRLFLTGTLLNRTGALSAESSVCIRDGLASTDLVSTLIATGSSNGAEVNAAAGRVMAAVILTLYCLNDEEFKAAGSAIVTSPDSRQSLQCVLDEVGGLEGLKALLQPDVGAGHPTDSFLAMMTCRSQLQGDP